MEAAEISLCLLNAAEERFQSSDFDGAIELMEHLLRLPNSSFNHALYSRYLVAYSVHSSVSEDRTHYETLGISDPFCDQETIYRQYMGISSKLEPRRNSSLAAKTALRMAHAAWNVLSDPARRRAYNVQIGLVKTTRQHRMKRSGLLRDEKPERLAKRSSVEILENLE